MRTMLRPLLLSLIAMLLASARHAQATALTYSVSANERACFYALIKDAGAKVAFYFAVQSGGSFDIDYTVTSPSLKVIVEGEKERQGDFVFTANEIGEYRFCFLNEMSTFAEKLVDFEIAVENEDRAVLPVKQAGGDQQEASMIENSIHSLSGKLTSISRTQKYFRTRENRNFATVRSTESRIFYFSFVEVLAIVVMALGQVAVVQFFFTGARKGFV
ncbi:emp24/gp25L/p24 family/GOLD-domain-containing protein [Limtongia smithiae]|uniref:emp24/gp25L/p24 family/GOLD-domain-containing protein n=1 Tax=Limtongia smithiae TaxID=1125753 RepID=UPI0034CF468F